MQNLPTARLRCEGRDHERFSDRSLCPSVGFSEAIEAAPLPCIGNVQADAKNPHELRTKTRTKSLRGGCWAEPAKKEPEDVIERRFLYDRGGHLAAHIVQEGDGWWLAYPSMAPEPPIESLEAATKRAETVALWALPLDPATAQRIRAANRAAWRDRLLDNPGHEQTAGVQSRWMPSPTPGDFPDIPAFLKRSAVTSSPSNRSWSFEPPSNPMFFRRLQRSC